MVHARAVFKAFGCGSFLPKHFQLYNMTVALMSCRYPVKPQHTKKHCLIVKNLYFFYSATNLKWTVSNNLNELLPKQIGFGAGYTDTNWQVEAAAGDFRPRAFSSAKSATHLGLIEEKNNSQMLMMLTLKKRLLGLRPTSTRTPAGRDDNLLISKEQSSLYSGLFCQFKAIV